MKNLNLYDAVYFLRQCAGILLEGRYIKPTLLELSETGDPNNEWLHLTWDEVDEEYGEVDQILVPFTEGDNDEVHLNGCTLILTNTSGEKEELTLLREWHPLLK